LRIRSQMLLLLSLLSISSICSSFKILVINPKFAYSHMNFLGQVADTLVDAGHDVVTLQPLMSTLFASNGTTKSRLIQVGPSAELNELLRIHHASAVKQDIWTSSLRNPFALLAVRILLAHQEKSSTKRKTFWIYFRNFPNKESNSLWKANRKGQPSRSTVMSHLEPSAMYI
uniref:Glucuronosyltransferase n=1 Tax=Haemonchus placei TaxID=6290 RepID=A0A0N4WNJ6_HAEPC